VTVESNWNPNALSHAGAIGLAQLMPETAGAVEKYGGVPPYKETQGYVRKILGK